MKARKANPLIKAINDQVTSYKREAEGYMNKMRKIKQDRMLIRALYSPVFADFVGDLYVHTFASEIHFTVYMHELDSFKDDRLTTLISRILDVTGSNVSTSENDYAQYDYKSYRFRAKDVVFEITAYIKSDSPTCKKIMTGMEMKEVPTYKFVCE
jgi:phage FluMu protein Com